MYFSSPFDDESPKSFCISTEKIFDELQVMEIGYNRPPKDHFQIMKRDKYILHYVVDGCGEFCGHPFKESDCYLVVPHELETIRTDSEWPYETYWIMFQGIKAKYFLKKCNITPKNSVFRFDKTKECAEILKNALLKLKTANEFSETAIMHSALMEIFSLHFSEAKTAPPPVSPAQKIMQFISENYFSNITIDSIAKNFNFSRNYLYTLFKKEFGISPQAHILNMRIKRAKELILSEESLRINEIALAVGYNDPLYFSRLFKKKEGCSPLEFAKKNRKGSPK